MTRTAAPTTWRKVSLDGVIKIVSIALVDDVQVGDYVVLHVGYALAKIDAEEARATLELLQCRRSRRVMRSRVMKYVDEYRDGALAARDRRAASRARPSPSAIYRFMEFCGGHTHAISRYGLEDLLPANVRMIHGPGCPVCVLPMARIDMAIACAREPEVTLCAYGDLMRVPGSQRRRAC